MKNVVVMAWQLVTYFMVGIPLRVLFRVRTSVSFEFEKGKRYIIAANHPRRIDPFLISYSFPLRYFIRLIPLRFITAEEYMENVFLRPFLLLYGCITTRKVHGETVLERSKALLEKGETIFILPCGGLERRGKNCTPKVGVVYLEREVKESVILPVKISYRESYKRSVKIQYKRLLRHTEFPKDLQPLAKGVYERIREDGPR